MEKNIKNEGIEKYKDLYLRSKEVLLEDLNRFNRIDEKASKYIAILTFLAGIYGFLFNKIFTGICQPTNLIEWLLLTNGIISFVLIVFAWFSVFYVLQQHSVLKVSFNDNVIKFYDDNNLIDIYYAVAKENKDSIQKNRLVIDRKIRKLDSAYDLIKAAMMSFLFLTFLYGDYIFFSPDRNQQVKKEVSIMAKEKDTTPKETQKVEPLKQQTPNPNVQAPKNEWITEGFDPKKSGKVEIREAIIIIKPEVEIKEVVVPVKPEEGKIEKGVIPKDKNK
ncbi:MAG TPA: hypothetical protein DCY56_06800 [Candidatus Omnitrophica bacterium]|nr:hypothetical protein [Candidatus Omnitrophota bacterium]